MALALGRLPLLKVLGLGGNGRGDDAVAALGQGHLDTLETLNLCGNDMTDEGARKLAAGHLPNLVELAVGRNPLRAEGAGVEALRSGHLPRLRTIRFSVDEPTEN